MRTSDQPWVLLDLDGTLTDPYDGITRCILHALDGLGLPAPDEPSLRRVIGPPLQDGFASLGVAPGQVDQAVRLYREGYSTTGLYENHLYDGIPELLGDLRRAGRRLALATSKPEVFAQRVLDHVGLAEHIDVVGGATLDGTRRHKADVIAHVLAVIDSTGTSAQAQTGASIHRPVMVGDRAQDVLGAQAHGLRCVGVGWGYADPGELQAAGADPVVSTPAELLQALIG